LPDCTQFTKTFLIQFPPIWQLPDIDLFASRLNFQVEQFCSWNSDPQSEFVNAFTVNWGKLYFIYLFPPFSLLNRCIRKIKTDKASGMIINWLLNFLDLKSAKIFCFPGIWEHDSHILLSIQNNKICLLTFLHEVDLIPSILVM
jgi:hypothetical protein